RRIIAVTKESADTGKPPSKEVADEVAALGRKALMASRINFMLSIPMLFFMGAGSHLPVK
ncbi:MAG: hypothetical protein E8D45_03650, partial [Nitrospira sp.]